MVKHQVVKLEIVEDIAGSVDLLQNGDKLNTKWVDLHAWKLFFVEDILEIDTMSLHDHVRITSHIILSKLTFTAFGLLLIDSDEESLLQYLWSTTEQGLWLLSLGLSGDYLGNLLQRVNFLLRYMSQLLDLNH